mgnify:FL=1
MKFILGVIIGIAVGGYLASNMTEEQRTKVGDAAGKAAGTVKQSKVVSAVADNAAKVTDTVSDRAADAVDAAGDKVADAVSADDATVS